MMTSASTALSNESRSEVASATNDRCEDLSFRGEMVIDGSLCHAGATGNVVDRGCHVTVPTEMRTSRLDDSADRRFAPLILCCHALYFWMMQLRAAMPACGRF
jgi:hypothetical protein